MAREIYASRDSPCTCSEYEPVCRKAHAVACGTVQASNFKFERVDKDGDVLLVPPVLEGYVENAILFKQGLVRKPKRQQGFHVCLM